MPVAVIIRFRVLPLYGYTMQSFFNGLGYTEYLDFFRIIYPTYSKAILLIDEN